MPVAFLLERDARVELAVAVDARQQDDYWSRIYSDQRYFRPGCDYEDYAPAYCVGYVGHAQYGGSWDEAEVSLRANWERIKGGSRLTREEAMAAIRAAWDKAAAEHRPHAC